MATSIGAPMQVSRRSPVHTGPAVIWSGVLWSVRPSHYMSDCDWSVHTTHLSIKRGIGNCSTWSKSNVFLIKNSRATGNTQMQYAHRQKKGKSFEQYYVLKKTKKEHDGTVVTLSLVWSLLHFAPTPVSAIIDCSSFFYVIVTRMDIKRAWIRVVADWHLWGVCT